MRSRGNIDSSIECPLGIVIPELPIRDFGICLKSCFPIRIDGVIPGRTSQRADFICRRRNRLLR